MASLVRMNLLTWTLVGVGVFLLLYAALVLALVIAGRRESARALAGFIPDCIVLCGRLLGHPRVPRRKKALLVVLTGSWGAQTRSGASNQLVYRGNTSTSTIQDSVVSKRARPGVRSNFRPVSLAAPARVKGLLRPIARFEPSSVGPSLT